jgi:HTH-type transcriptional regulator/antitoxin MqsA
MKNKFIICPICGSSNIKKKKNKVVYKYKGHELEVEQPGEYCDSCGEIFLSPDDMKFSRKAREDFKRKAEKNN